MTQLGLYGPSEAAEGQSRADQNNGCDRSLFCNSFNITCHKKFSIDFYASPEDLDKITEEDDFHGAQGKRKAASKAVVQQRKILSEGSDGDSANDSEPDSATGEL